MTTMAKDSSIFWDKVAEKYYQRPVSNPAAWDQTLDSVRRYLRPEDRVLEIGGGTGGSAERLAPSVADYTLSDISAEMLRMARQRLAQCAVRNINLVEGTIHDRRFSTQSFDAIVALNVFHLIADVPAALAASFERLRPGGYLIAKSGTIGGWRAIIQIPIGMMRLFGKAPRVTSFTDKGFETMARRAGFEILESRRIPENSISHFVVLRRPASL